MKASLDGARAVIITGAVVSLVGAALNLMVLQAGGNATFIPMARASLVIVVSVLACMVMLFFKGLKISANLHLIVMFGCLALEIILGDVKFFSITGLGMMLQVAGTTLLFVAE